MRLSLRFLIPLLLALAGFAYLAVPVADGLTARWFMRDLEGRSALIASAVQEPLREMIATGNRSRMLQFFTQVTRDERFYAMGFCPSGEGPPLATPTLPPEIRCNELDKLSEKSGHLLKSADGPLLVSVQPIVTDSGAAGSLVLVHDMGFVERRREKPRRYLFTFFAGLGALVSLVTVIIAQLSWRRR